MIGRYHVNAETSRVGVCQAKNECPLGNDTPHFSSRAEAIKHLEKIEASNYRIAHGSLVHETLNKPRKQNKSNKLQQINASTVLQNDSVDLSENFEGNHNSSSNIVLGSVREAVVFPSHAIASGKGMHKSSAPSIHKIQGKLSSMDAHQLAQKCFREINVDHSELENVLELASVLHFGQTRRSRAAEYNTPYIEHPMRAALRVQRWGINNPDVLKAALLHDTLEDCSDVYSRKIVGATTKDKYEQRKLLQSYIANRFGSNTAVLVANVSNDIVDGKYWRSLSPQERRNIYLQHLSAAVEGSPETLALKLSDFVDNAGSLHLGYSDNPSKVYNSAKKYLPCVRVFENNIGDNYLFSSKARGNARESLAKINENLISVIDAHEKERN